MVKLPLIEGFLNHPLRHYFQQRYRFKRALKSKVQIGLNPQMAVGVRHGTITFAVSGFGEIQKHFVVNDRDTLVNQAKRYAYIVARQAMLLDKRLPKNETICQAVRIDIVGSQVRRAYSLPSFALLLEQGV